MNGSIRAISVSDRKGIKKRNVERARLIENHGIEGDAHAGDWHRQISLLAEESIQKIIDKGLDVGAGDFAENLTTAGIDLPGIPIGTKIRVGDNCILEITQIGKECHSRCAIFSQVGDCVMPREGIFARVIVGGDISVGAPVSIID